MKKLIYVLMVPLVVLGGFVFANKVFQKEGSGKAAPRPLTEAQMAVERKNWEASPDGIRYTQWTVSPEGEKVLSDAAKIKNHIKDYTYMKAVVTALSLPPGSRLGFGVMVRIDGSDYILRFDTDKSQLAQLQGLKVNDALLIKSHSVSHAPKYSYPIISCEYAERDGKIIYKHAPRKDGC